MFLEPKWQEIVTNYKQYLELERSMPPAAIDAEVAVIQPFILFLVLEDVIPVILPF